MEDTRPILIRRTDPIYGYLFNNVIPTLISASTSRDNYAKHGSYITRIEIFQPDELSGPWNTCEYNGNVNNVHTIYKVNKEEY